MPNVSTASLGELIELAVTKDLVAYCYFSKDAVLLAMGRHQLTYTHEECRTLLTVLLQGLERSHPSVAKPTASLHYRHPSVDPAEPTIPLDEARHALSRDMPPKPRTMVTSSEEYVDAVLAFAEEMRLIEGFDKDEDRGKVTLHTQATTTDMSYFETLEYLTSSILDELRSTDELHPPQHKEPTSG